MGHDPFGDTDNRLLRLGGEEVIHREGETPIPELLTRGQLFTLPVKQRQSTGKHHRSKAAGLWGRSVNKYQLVLGYALHGDSWVKHSWVTDGKVLYDPSDPADAYFGVVLEPQEAVKIWFGNYLPDRYPGPAELIMREGEVEKVTAGSDGN